MKRGVLLGILFLLVCSITASALIYTDADQTIIARCLSDSYTAEKPAMTNLAIVRECLYENPIKYPGKVRGVISQCIMKVQKEPECEREQQLLWCMNAKGYITQEPGSCLPINDGCCNPYAKKQDPDCKIIQYCGEGVQDCSSYGQSCTSNKDCQTKYCSPRTKKCE